MRGLLIAILTLALGANSSAGQASATVFKGRPSLKISEGGLERTPEQIPRDRAINLECVISQVGTSYYWASRENVPLSRIDSGGFVTFVAVNGSGYGLAVIDSDGNWAFTEDEAALDESRYRVAKVWHLGRIPWRIIREICVRSTPPVS